MPNLILVFLLAITGITMKWGRDDKSIILITAPNPTSELERCVEGGLSVEYRYEVKLCRRRVMWFDSCDERYVETRSLVKEPISGQYRIEGDLFHDDLPPEARSVKGLSQGFNYLQSIEVPVSNIVGKRTKDHLESEKAYVSARVLSACKGSFSPTVRRLSQFLTFGIMDIRGSDSGWIDFYLSS